MEYIYIYIFHIILAGGQHTNKHIREKRRKRYITPKHFKKFHYFLFLIWVSNSMFA